jgi:hypothetical protein
MTYAPASIQTLARYWTAHGGRNLGIVGDTRHRTRGTSYHLGRSQLTSDAYSRITPRDRAGLSEAASALDLGALNGNLGQLRTFSRWFVERCRTNAPGTSDVREFIYSPDGIRVLRWDRERGVSSAPRTGEADNSHLGHSHISFYRDSQERSKVGLFSPYFVAPPDTSTGADDVRVVTVTNRRWPSPRRFKAKVAELRRFTATEELDPIPGFYEGWAAGTTEIQGNEGVPHGVGFLELASGGSAGKYVLAAQVALEGE